LFFTQAIYSCTGILVQSQIKANTLWTANITTLIEAK